MVRKFQIIERNSFDFMNVILEFTDNISKKLNHKLKGVINCSVKL